MVCPVVEKRDENKRLHLAERQNAGKHIVIRYENRKLYSRRRGGYISHIDILDMLALKEFFIVLTSCGEDVTEKTMRQILAQLITSGAFSGDEVLEMVYKHLQSRKTL
jgi:polyhydroxyalkanoate synthesis regulator protein